MACDICNLAGVRMESLHEQYTTREIRLICADCAKAVNDRNSALLTALLKKKADEIKVFVVERRAAKRLSAKAAMDREASLARRR